MGYHSGVPEYLFSWGVTPCQTTNPPWTLDPEDRSIINFGGYQSTPRNNPEEVSLRRKTSSGWRTDCLFRYVDQKLIRGRYTPIIPSERRKGWRLASLLWGHNGVATMCRRRTNVKTVQQRLRCYSTEYNGNLSEVAHWCHCTCYWVWNLAGEFWSWCYRLA